MGTDIHGVFQRRISSGWKVVPTIEWNMNRHYQLFAVLAGVRNGVGFAGIPTGTAIKPIAAPRGWPTDFKLPKDVEWMGDHSFSWLGSGEMLAWFKNAPTVIHCGVLSREEYNLWDKQSQPEAYCGMISGPAIIVVEDNAVAKSKCAWTHVRCYWQRSLGDELKYFFEEVAELAKLHGEIRFVFGFDS